MEKHFHEGKIQNDEFFSQATAGDGWKVRTGVLQYIFNHNPTTAQTAPPIVPLRGTSWAPFGLHGYCDAATGTFHLRGHPKLYKWANYPQCRAEFDAEQRALAELCLPPEGAPGRQPGCLPLKLVAHALRIVQH